MKDYQFLQKKYVVPSYANRGLTLVRGDGVYLFDDNGNKYLDLMGNYGVNIFGYNNAQINKAIINQLKKLSNLHGSFTSDVRAEASEKLVKRCGLNYSKVYWSNSGAEAIDAALKFAALSTNRKKFVAAKGSFHGKTLGALSATGMSKYRLSFEPLLWQFVHVDYNDIGQLKKAVDKKTTAVILEPIQGESGIIVPDEGYLREAQRVCKASGSLLILDEVQTGVGRTGWFLASQETNVDADIVCLGKGLAGGLPVGATIVKEDIASKIPKSSQTSTLGGNPLVSAATLATLGSLDEKTLQHIKRIGRYLINSLKSIESDLIVEIRGRGLMIAIQVNRDRDRILKDLQKNGVLAIPAADDVVRFLPPYIINRKQIDNAVGIFQKILS
ncbi:aspartate aminotransferase family protein [Patescibacteria group bacterium]|nr:aspartate aminotransferase family protein [Patescibacteria group bacterium]